MEEEAGGWVSADAAARLLGMSKPSVLKRFQKAQLLGWRELRQNAVRFPVWQFSSGGLLSGLDRVLAVLRKTPLDATRSTMAVDLGALMHTDLSVPQAWGRAIQEHPAGFGGIRYLSRFSQRPCLALFEKPGFALRGRLLDPLPASRAAARFLERHDIALY